MADPLSTYIDDHMAGSVQAIELVEYLRGRHGKDPVGRFASKIHSEITEDRSTLSSVSQKIGPGPSRIKEAAAWLGEKVSRLKLRVGDEADLGTFEALELLGLGIHGKRAMWRALNEIAASDGRLSEFDFQMLAERAERQGLEVERLRLETARTALMNGGPTQYLQIPQQ
jgi:hypothetical protein